MKNLAEGRMFASDVTSQQNGQAEVNQKGIVA